MPTYDRCRLCDSGEREDVPHLLLSCSSHRRYRARMVNAVTNIVSRCSTDEFHSAPPADQVDTLLGKSTGDALADDRIDQLVTRFLKKAWRTRKPITVALNDKLGRQDTVWALKAHGDGEYRPVPSTGIYERRAPRPTYESVHTAKAG